MSENEKPTSTKAVDKKIEKIKKDTRKAEKADRQDIKDDAALQVFMEKQVKTQIEPASKMIFGMINNALQKYQVAPFTDAEIKEVMYIIQEKAFGGKTPDILQKAESQTLNIRIIIFAITSIIPRIYNFITKLKPKKSDEDILSGGYPPQ